MSVTEFVFDPDWNEDADMAYTEMTMLQKRRHRMNCFFNIFIQSSIEDAQTIPSKIEQLKRTTLDGKLYVKHRNALWIHWEFNKTRRHAISIMKRYILQEIHINTRQDSFVLPGETVLYPQGPDDIDPDIGRPIPLDAILEYDSRTISSIGCYLTQVLSISLRIHQHIRKLNRKMIRKAGYIEAAEVEAVYSTFANEIQTVYADFKTENSHFR